MTVKIRDEDGVGYAFPRPIGIDDGAGNVVRVSAAAPLPMAQAGSASTNRFAASAASNNATLVKASPGLLTQISGNNESGSDRFLRLYDKASGVPLPAADTARKVYKLPAGSSFVFDCWNAFATGIGFAITAARADLDNTPIAANDITCFNLDFT
jgi:hypothetical protein